MKQVDVFLKSDTNGKCVYCALINTVNECIDDLWRSIATHSVFRSLFDEADAESIDYDKANYKFNELIIAIDGIRRYARPEQKVGLDSWISLISNALKSVNVNERNIVFVRAIIDPLDGLSNMIKLIDYIEEESK